MPQSTQIVRQPGKDFLPASANAGDHVDDWIECQLTRPNALKRGYDPAEHFPTAQGRVPESGPGAVQALSQGQLLLPVQEGNRSHLPQIEAQGVIERAGAVMFL